MAKTKNVEHFVAVSDTSKSPAEQEGVLVAVEGRGGDTPKNRAQALEQVNQMWENGEIAEDKFPDGISQDNIFYVPTPEGATMTDPGSGLAPIVQGAQEIVQLTKLQIEVQEAAEEAAPYTPIVEAVLERSRPLTPEEKNLAKEKKYGKTIERLGLAVATQEDFQAQCTGYGKLILNAIAWQLSQQPAAVAAPAPAGVALEAVDEEDEETETTLVPEAVAAAAAPATAAEEEDYEEVDEEYDEEDDEEYDEEDDEEYDEGDDEEYDEDDGDPKEE